MAGQLFKQHRVIDVDTHVTEPRDVWTSRVSSRWGDRVPHVVDDPEGGPKEVWVAGDEVLMAAGISAMAGFDGELPDHPDRIADAIPAAYDAKERLRYMDQEGIWGQVLYPNIGGFGSGGFLRLGEPELMLECVRAYNDFLVDWAGEDPQRLIPVMALPFWDVEASVAEIERSARTGHKAVLFGSQPQVFGQPRLTARHWDPVWAAAQDHDLSISFHIGGGMVDDLLDGTEGIGIKAGLARGCSLLFFDNQRCLADLIFGGICHRFPRLKFVSVESGAGWIPAALDTFDWQWANNWVGSEHPEYDLKPSEYFRRQIYACFWFEDSGIQNAIELYPDNILYETDFPHPTSMSVGPRSAAEHPSDYAERVLGGLASELQAKVLHDTAAQLYHLN
jgi:predicted TIM-barrel fold metal-dependent hydrolase